MALISNNISGSASNSSRVGITGSVIVANTPGSRFPLLPGNDVIFFVSGNVSTKPSQAPDYTKAGTSVFGGDVVISGTLFGGTPLSIGDNLIITTNQISGSFGGVPAGSITLLAGGDVRIARDLHTGTSFFDIIDPNSIARFTTNTSSTILKDSNGTSRVTVSGGSSTFLIDANGSTAVAIGSAGTFTISNNGISGSSGANISLGAGGDVYTVGDLIIRGGDIKSVVGGVDTTSITLKGAGAVVQGTLEVDTIQPKTSGLLYTTINSDLLVNGNDILDSTGTTRVSLGSTTTVTATTTTLSGDLRVNGNDIIDSGGTTRITLGSNTTVNGNLYLANTDTISIGLPSIGGVTTIPQIANQLQIKQSNNTSRTIAMQRSDTEDRWGFNVNASNQLDFSFNGSSRGYLDDATNVANIDFTGQHRVSYSGSIDIDSSVGLIVVSTGRYDSHNEVSSSVNNISINESLPIVSISSNRNQKSVFGVISDQEDDSDSREYKLGNFVSIIPKKSGDSNRLIVNSIGEGAIWVCNVNGSLENGDYITTSEIPGHGMKQDGDFLMSYTVAKITCDCDFDLNSEVYHCEEFQWNGQTYKKAFVGCIYHCG